MKTVTPTPRTNDQGNWQKRPRLDRRLIKVKKITGISQVVGFRVLVSTQRHKAEAACLVKALSGESFLWQAKAREIRQN
jgi:predicted xylose isomerase-like sugar epimerase